MCQKGEKYQQIIFHLQISSVNFPRRWIYRNSWVTKIECPSIWYREQAEIRLRRKKIFIYSIIKYSHHHHPGSLMGWQDHWFGENLSLKHTHTFIYSHIWMTNDTKIMTIMSSLHTVLGSCFCFSRFLVWTAGWYSHHVRKLGERLTNSNFDLVFQVSMGPKFFQYINKIILFTCLEFSTQVARHFVFLFFHWVPQLFAVPLPLFLTLLLHLENKYVLVIEWLTPLLEYEGLVQWNTYCILILDLSLPCVHHCTSVCTLSWIHFIFSYSLSPGLSQEATAHVW